MPKRTRTRRGLSNLSVDFLRSELARRQRALVGLYRRHAGLLRRVERVADAIRSAGGDVIHAATGDTRRARGRGAPGRRRRPRNDMNLVQALSKVLKNRTMSVTEVAEEVQRAGYKTSSANFRTIVNQTLIKSPAFKKVSRGKYTSK